MQLYHFFTSLQTQIASNNDDGLSQFRTADCKAKQSQPSSKSDCIRLASLHCRLGQSAAQLKTIGLPIPGFPSSQDRLSIWLSLMSSYASVLVQPAIRYL